MSYVAPLTYGVLIAHFIPGFILYVGLWVFAGQRFSDYFLLFDKNFWIPFVLTSITVSFSFGLFVDGFRAQFFDEIIQEISEDPDEYSRPTGLYEIIQSESSLRALDYLLEKYYRFYQLYSNTCVALFTLTLIWSVRTVYSIFPSRYAVLDFGRTMGTLLGLALLTYIMFRAAEGELWQSMDSLREFQRGNKKTQRSSLDSCRK